ncbi:DnaB-like helicase N-terminal domain-containing protein [Streptomyces sp. NBC_01481]|uniref:replicative DNA helicase n=1 Tax=Streptomyces sp. NBC_01481 TaxID=2975869 RepID=UPI002250396A|nr:DnaB-like helicase N-terminal domain-containing protein [Streptomyces sp. NBC_01481]MCX4582614.1 hypothetical protein [Streptomyces sp. NBC_01481]
MTPEPAPVQHANVLPMRDRTTENFTQAPPNDVTAEQSVLGSMLLSVDAIEEVAAVVDPGDHYRPAHETIHRAILDLHAARQPADPITVAYHLDKRGELSRVGGASYLHTLVNEVPTVANAEWYAEIVRDKANRRRLIAAGTRLMQAASSADSDTDEIRAAVLDEVTALVKEQSDPLEELPERTAGPPNPLYDPQPGIHRPHRQGPTPHPAVFCGWIGETVRELDPTTEADPIAVLANFLSAAGTVIGRRPHLMVGNDRHPCLIG